MVFSEPAQQNIRAFAAAMGITLQPEHKDGYGFNIADRGVLSLTEASDGGRMIVSLSFHTDNWGEGAEERLFALAHQEWVSGRMLRVGLSDNNHVFLGLSVDNDEISPQTLDDCLEQLLSARAEFG